MAIMRKRQNYASAKQTLLQKLSSSSSSSPRVGTSDVFVAFLVLLSCASKGWATNLTSSACVLSPSPFVHLDCGADFVRITNAFYSTICGDHGCRVARKGVKCSPEVSKECWVLVDQIPLVECGNYYSLFLEIQYDCVKDPLDENVPLIPTSAVGFLPNRTNVDLESDSEFDLNLVPNNSHRDSADENASHFSTNNISLTNDGSALPLNSSLPPHVTVILHRGPINNSQDVRLTTASRPLSVADASDAAKKTTPPPRRKITRRPLHSRSNADSSAKFSPASLLFIGVVLFGT